MSPMLGYNGGLRGTRRVPATGSASGIWDLEEQKIAASAGIWPSAGGDPYWANVSLLLHMNGSNGSTTFADSSSNGLTLTPNAGAQISTAQSKFGGSSGLFGGYLLSNMVPVLQFGTEAFTVEGWFYATSLPGLCTLFSVARYIDGVMLRTNGSSLQLYLNNNEYNSSYGVMTTNSWTHVALTRQDNSFNVWVNGVSVMAPTYSGSFTSTQQFALATATHNSDERFLGHIDEFRITKGICRYESSFTPPTAPFPNF